MIEPNGGSLAIPDESPTPEQRPFKASAAIDKIIAALVEVQKELKPATRTKANDYLDSRYADLASYLVEDLPLLAKHDLALIQLPGKLQGKSAELTSILAHISGQWISTLIECPLEKQTAQGLGSAITYMRRYSLSIYGAVQADDDGQSASEIPTLSEEQQLSLMAVVQEHYDTESKVNRVVAKLCKLEGEVDHIAKIRADRYEHCLGQIKHWANG